METMNTGSICNVPSPFGRLTLPFSELKMIYMSYILFLMHNFRPIYQNKHYFITSVPALFRNRSNLILFVYFTFYLLGYSATNIVYFNKDLFYCLTFISLDFKSEKNDCLEMLFLK